MQTVHCQPLDHTGNGSDEGIRPVDLDDGGDDAVVVVLLVLHAGIGVEQLIDDVGKVRRQRLTDLGTGVFGGHHPADLRKTPQGYPVPVAQIAGHVCLDVFQLVLGVVDEGCQFRPFPGGEGIAIDGVDLIPDNAGAVVEDMGKGLVLAVDVAHEMLGALGQRQNGLQVDQLGADLLDGAEFLGEQPQVSVTVIKMFHCCGKCPLFRCDAPSFPKDGRITKETLSGPGTCTPLPDSIRSYTRRFSKPVRTL